jgi:hypothetical protein
VTGIRYWFNEDGVEKFYDIPLIDKNDKPHYLIARFADINEGDKLEMEYIKKGKGGFIEITKVASGLGELPVVHLDEGDEEPIPGLD